MRPVNLLPEKHRAYVATGEQKGSAYIALGALGVLLVGVLLFVLTANQVTTRQGELSRAQAETKSANSRAGALQSYGSFGDVAKQRVASVKALAQTRLDYERMVRELAHVLPDGVYLSQLNASATGTPQTGSTAPASSTAGAAPTIALTGCAPSQPAVATTLVRAKALHGATDVELNQSTKSQSASSGGSSAAPAAATAPGACAKYQFQLTITLDTPSGTVDKSGSVPASLGGGS